MRIEMNNEEIQALSAAVAAAAMEILAPQLTNHLAAVSKAITAGQAKPQILSKTPQSAAPSVGSEIIGLAEVKRLTGLSESSIWRHEKRLGSFPLRRQLSTRRVGWYRDEVIAWTKGRPVT